MDLMFFRNSWFNRFLKIAHVGLRVLAIGFTATSIATMLTSDQEIYMIDDDIPVAKAHYSYSSALRYKLIIDAVVCVFSLLSSVHVYKKTKGSENQPKSTFYFCLLIVDAVAMALAVSGCAAATAVGFVGLNGLEKPGVSWTPVCNMVGKFCKMVTYSIAFSYAAFGCMTALTFISALKLKLLATD